MGNNSLSNTEKSLRSIAKRYENVKYSVGLAVLFLMNGASAFSDTNVVQETDRQKEVAKDSQAGKTVVKETKAEKKQTSQKLKASWVNMQFGANDMYSNYFAVPKAKVEKTSVVKSEKTVLVASADNTASLPMFAKLLTDIEETTENRTEVLTTIANKEETPTMEEIKASKQELRSSVGNLQDKIDTARRENNKDNTGLRLELIQLMEQGNQVVKSPWSSWQFGANYFYEDWGGAYKGRGDKAKEKLDLTGKLGFENREQFNHFIKTEKKKVGEKEVDIPLTKKIWYLGGESFPLYMINRVKFGLGADYEKKINDKLKLEAKIDVDSKLEFFALRSEKLFTYKNTENYRKSNKEKPQISDYRTTRWNIGGEIKTIGTVGIDYAVTNNLNLKGKLNSKLEFAREVINKINDDTRPDKDSFGWIDKSFGFKKFVPSVEFNLEYKW